MVTEIEPRTFDWRIDHRETFDALLAQRGIKLRLCRDMAPAEWTMQASKQADQYWALAAKVIKRDLTLACDRIQHNIRCAVARLEQPVDMMFEHGQSPSHC
jgi:hypothetical protein